MSVSVNVLLYGDFPHLASRCLKSLSAITKDPNLQDLRIGLNDVSPNVNQLVMNWVLAQPCAIYVLSPRFNVFKYPLMRKMFGVAPLADYTMWFDDDSYIDPSWQEKPGFLAAIEQLFSDPKIGMLGEVWYKRWLNGQDEWYRSRPWYRGIPFEKYFTFATGGWWTIRTEILLQNDWPDSEIRHNGGDIALGELLHQQGLRIGDIRSKGLVQVNDAERRGWSEKPIGAVGTSGNRPEHNFEFTIMSNRPKV